MARLGKKILSAFIETGEDSDNRTTPDARAAQNGQDPAAREDLSPAGNAGGGTGSKFREYFDRLFSDANIPGPDYYEFSKMIEAMRAIPDEQARYYAAFAGLQAQGLDRQKLLSTAADYLRILETDAANFRQTVDTALQEKVQGKKTEMEEKTRRIQALTQEIGNLQQEIAALQSVVKENEEKIEASSGGYARESAGRKDQILADIENINHFIH